MPVPQELLDTINEYEKQGAKPEDLIPELMRSKTYPEVATKFQDYVLLGGDPLEIYNDLKKSPVQPKGDFMRDYVKPMIDTAIGIPESIATLTSGIGSFILGVGIAGGGLIHQIAKQGHFETGWTNARDTLNKVMETGTYKPISQLGKTAGIVGGSLYEAYKTSLSYGAEKLGIKSEEGKAAVEFLGAVAALYAPKVAAGSKNIVTRIRMERAEQALRGGDIEGGFKEFVDMAKTDPEATKIFNDELAKFEDTMKTQMEFPEMKGLPKKEGYVLPEQLELARREVEKIEVPGKKKKIEVERIYRPFEGLPEKLPQEELPFKPYWYEETKVPEQPELPKMWEEYKGAVEKKPAFEVRAAETQTLIDRIKTFGKDYLEQRDRSEAYAKIEADKLRAEIEGMRTTEEVDSVKRIAESKVNQGKDYAKWMVEEMGATKEELAKRGVEVPEEVKPIIEFMKEGTATEFDILYHGTKKYFGIDKELTPKSMSEIIDTALQDVGVSNPKKLKDVIVRKSEYFGEETRALTSSRQLEEKQIFLTKDINEAKEYAKWAGEAYHNALLDITTYAPEYAKKADVIIKKLKLSRPVVYAVKVPKGNYGKGDITFAEALRDIKEIEETGGKSDLDLALEEGFKAKAEKLGIEFVGMKENLPEFKTPEGKVLRVGGTDTVEGALDKVKGIVSETEKPLITTPTGVTVEKRVTPRTKDLESLKVQLDHVKGLQEDWKASTSPLKGGELNRLAEVRGRLESNIAKIEYIKPTTVQPMVTPKGEEVVMPKAEIGQIEVPVPIRIVDLPLSATGGVAKKRIYFKNKEDVSFVVKKLAEEEIYPKAISADQIQFVDIPLESKLIKAFKIEGEPKAEIIKALETTPEPALMKTEWWKKLDEETKVSIAKEKEFIYDHLSETLVKDIEGEFRVKEVAKAENKTVEEVTRQPEIIEDSAKAIDEVTPLTRDEIIKTYLEMTVAEGKSRVELYALLKKKFPTEKGLNNFFEALKRGDLEHSYEDVLNRIDDKAGEIFERDAENPIWNEEGFIDLSPIISVPKQFVRGILDTIEVLKDKGIKKEELRAIAVAESARAIRLQVAFYRSMGGTLPGRQSMKLPPFRKAYELGKEVTKGIEIDRLKWVYNRMDKMLRKLPKELEPNFYRYMQADINEVPTRFRSIIGEHRTFWNELIAKGKEAGYDIGYELNYLPHMFEKWGVETAEDIHATFYKTDVEAIKAARVLESQGKTVIKIEPNFSLDLATLDKKTLNVLERLKNDMTYTVEAGRKLPDEKFFGNWLARRSDNPYYKTNYKDVIKAYTHGVIKKIHTDKFIDGMEEIFKNYKEELGEAGRSALIDYAESVLGRPTWLENKVAEFAHLIGSDITPYGVMNMSKKAALLQYNLDLGIVVTSALSNSFQGMNPAAIFGQRYMSIGGYRAFNALIGRDKGRYAELVNGGIIQEVPAGFEMGFGGKLATIPLIMFQSVERWNRASTYFAAKSYARENYSKAIRVLNLMDVPPSASIYGSTGEAFVEKFADEMVDNTQFRTEPFNIPGALRSPIVKTALPYKGFAIETHVFQYKLVKGLFKDVKLAAPILATFMALSYLLGGKEANVLTDVTYMASDEAFKRVFGMAISDVKFNTPAGEIKFGDILRRGLPAHLGFDISGAVSIQNPLAWFRKGQQAYGRYLQFAGALMAGDTEKMWKAILPRIAIKARNAYIAGKEGEYTTWKGHLIAKVSKKDAYKILAGEIPPKVAEFYRDREGKFAQLDWYKKNVLERIDTSVGYSMKKNRAKADAELKKIRDEREGYFKQFTIAKPGDYKERLRQRLMFIDRALGSIEIFENARRRRREGVLERENDAILKAYSILHMREMFGEEFVKPVEQEEY